MSNSQVQTLLWADPSTWQQGCRKSRRRRFGSGSNNWLMRCRTTPSLTWNRESKLLNWSVKKWKLWKILAPPLSISDKETTVPILVPHLLSIAPIQSLLHQAFNVKEAFCTRPPISDCALMTPKWTNSLRVPTCCQRRTSKLLNSPRS